MAIGNKERYLARGDSVSPGEGPREDVIGSTQLMSASRFSQVQATVASLSRFASSAWHNGGQQTFTRPGSLFTPIKVVAGTGSTVSFDLTDDGTAWDVDNAYISGSCTAREGGVGAGDAIATPAIDWIFARADIDKTDIPFEDNAARNYNVGIACCVVPARAEQNPRTGLYEWTEELAVMGLSMIPATVTYSASLDKTTLLFGTGASLINGYVSAPNSLAGRTAVAWKADPLGDTSVSLIVGVVSFTTENQIVISGSFGQDPSSVSLVATDYRVAVLGPAIFSSNPSLGGPSGVSGVAHLAYGRNSSGGSWDMDGQMRVPHAHLMLETLIEMTAPSVSSPDFISRPKISIAPSTNEPVGTPQLTVYENANRTGVLFQVKKGGALTGALGTFTDLATFVDVSAAGDLAVVDATDYTKMPFAELDSVIAAENECFGVHSDGKYLFTIEGDPGAPEAAITVYDAEDLAAGFIAQLTGQNVITGAAGNPIYTAFSADGAFIALAINDTGVTASGVKAYQWNSSNNTITHQWTYFTAPYAAINDIVCSNGAVYIVEDDDGAGGNNITRMPFDAGVGGATVTVADADWSSVYGSNKNAVAVAAGGGYVVVTGETTGVGTGQQVRVFNDSAALVIVSTQNLGVLLNAHPRMLACDGVDIFLLDDTGGLWRLPVHPLVQAAVQAPISALSAITTGHLCIDHQFIYVLDASPTGVVVVVKKDYSGGNDGTEQGWFGYVTKTNLAVDNIHDVCSDGVRVFVGNQDLVDGSDSIMSLNRPGQKPTIFRRNLASDATTPYKQLAQPAG